MVKNYVAILIYMFATRDPSELVEFHPELSDWCRLTMEITYLIKPKKYVKILNFSYKLSNI